MRSIPFASASFSVVYSYNAIFFMTKPDIARAMREMARVLKPDGLCYVNFLSVDDPDRGPFCDSAPLRHLLKSERFAHHADDEADAYFTGFEILRKEKRLIDKVHAKGRLKQAYIEYIARKGF
jgi:ubiquinone/menaquinone biosynthesis C-methylase UbiE